MICTSERIYLPRRNLWGEKRPLQLSKRITAKVTTNFIIYRYFHTQAEVQHERWFLARVCTRLSLAGVTSRKAEARLKLGSWLEYLGGLPLSSLPSHPTSHHFLSFLPFSSIVFQLFEKCPRLLSAKQTILLQFNDLVYSRESYLPYLGERTLLFD